MFKRLLLGALALVLVAAEASAAGMWTLSYSQRHDINGKPYPGARAYFYDASTGDPITVYREYSLATPHTNPVEADGNGTFPGVFISSDETFYRFRVTTAAGVVLSDTVTVPNLGPADGGGDPAEPVPEAALAKTGDLKARYDEGIHEGWLPLNGRTMGSSTSGADYATDDNEALFLFLWAKDSSKVVGGAGVSAAADWSANKRLTLPNAKGRALVGLDDMDSSAASVLTGLDTLGETTGSQSITLTAGQIPQITGTTNSNGAHYHYMFVGANGSGDLTASNYARSVRSGGTDSNNYQIEAVSTEANIGRTSQEGAHTHTVTAGSSTPTAVTTVMPSMGVTIYIKK